mmetsp:Transcript_27212/g.50862  ORF Transcript_27212/g.50862 Transcript_27212/m.50862 type:complete len:150 (+) Transcript_27212:761-1210(+)
MDAKTREKFVILSSDYYEKLSELIDPSVIPVEYGGECEEGGENGVHWDLKFPSCTGCSRQQIEDNTKENLLKYCHHFTPDEAINMFKALTISGFHDGAMEIKEKMRKEEKELPASDEKAMLTAALAALDALELEKAVCDLSVTDATTTA